VCQIAESERDGSQIEGCVWCWKLQGIGFEKRGAAFAARRDQHGVRKIAGENARRRPAPLERERQIASAAANIQNACAGLRENRRHSRHGAAAPMAIDIHRQQMVQQVVARGDAPEHPAHPGGSLLLGFSARGRGA